MFEIVIFRTFLLSFLELFFKLKIVTFFLLDVVVFCSFYLLKNKAKNVLKHCQTKENVKEERPKNLWKITSSVHSHTCKIIFIIKIFLELPVFAKCIK